MPVFSDCLISFVFLALTALTAHAAEPHWPTRAEIEHARSQHPLPTLEDIKRQNVPGLPKIDDPKRPAIDVEAIARRYTENSSAFAEAHSAQPSLKIFVTLAMPLASLKRLTAQAARAQATLVIRGLKDDSMRATLAAVQKIIGEHQVAWQIDPPAFARYGIVRAPTFVLIAGSGADAKYDSSCTTGCERPEAYVSVAGDASLEYVLEFIARTKPAFADEAQPYLQRLRG